MYDLVVFRVIDAHKLRHHLTTSFLLFLVHQELALAKGKVVYIIGIQSHACT